jgi:hypothetical protein
LVLTLLLMPLLLLLTLLLLLMPLLLMHLLLLLTLLLCVPLRYGAIPVVRHTGGLRDTVFDVDSDKERAAWEVYGSTDYMADKVDGTNGFAFEVS